jgi:uncharacterized protein YbjT (DUF2867 family)
MANADILIAGATGTNGREILRILKERGIPARALVRDPARAADIAAMGFELAEGDLSDPASLAAALRGIRAFVLLTPVSQQALTLTETALAAAREANVGDVVRFSGLGASPSSPAEIIRIHGMSDAALIASGLNFTILRPNGFFQNLLHQAQPIREMGMFFLPLGDSRQSHVDVRDIAEAAANILIESHHAGKIYEITGPEALSCEDMAASLSAATGRTIRYQPVPVEAAAASMLEMGLPEWDARAIAELQGLFATGWAEATKPDLETLLGRPPRRFADFARDFAGAFS